MNSVKGLPKIGEGHIDLPIDVKNACPLTKI